MQDAIAEDGLAKVQPELYSQEDKALAEVEEAWLAVGEEARDPAAPDWPGQEVAAAYGGSLASIERLLDHMSNLATKAQPQQDYHNGSTAVGQAGGGPCALKRSLEAHGSSVQTLVRSHNIKSTHHRPLVIPPRFDTGVIKVALRATRMNGTLMLRTFVHACMAYVPSAWL